MEVNLIAVKMMIMLMLGALAISLIYFNYLEIDRRIRRKSRRMIYDKIVECLFIYCRLRDISVCIDNGAFKEDHAEAAAYISFCCDENTGIVYEATIYLRNDEDIYIDLKWSILAHEVGHYISQDIYIMIVPKKVLIWKHISLFTICYLKRIEGWYQMA